VYASVCELAVPVQHCVLRCTKSITRSLPGVESVLASVASLVAVNPMRPQAAIASEITSSAWRILRP
jgi:hypothetical protein